MGLISFIKNAGASILGGGQANAAPAEELKKAGINAVFYESPRTAHEFLTWRRCLREFAPLLFQ